jgi:ketosteroid isomerase-like protein
MSGQNSELALRAYEAFNERDLEAFLAVVDERTQIHSRIVAIEGGYTGTEGARRWWHDLLEFLPDYRIEVKGEIRELGDATVAELHARGHGAASAAPLEETIWQTIRWRDGKCAWWRNCPTEAEALKAAEGG